MPEPKTYGITHLALAVADVERSLGFYTTVFDLEVMYRRAGFAQPGEPYLFCTDPDGYQVEVWFESVPAG